MVKNLSVYIPNEELSEFVLLCSSQEDFTLELAVEDLPESDPTKSHPSYKLVFVELTPLIISLLNLTTSIVALSTVIFTSLSKRKQEEKQESKIIVQIGQNKMFFGSGMSKDEITEALRRELESSIEGSIQNEEE